MKSIAVGAAIVVLAGACSSSKAPASAYKPVIDPAKFTSTIDNPYFTLKPGTVYHYTATVEGKTETNDVAVTHQTSTIMGVKSVVVRDLVRSEGKLSEDTVDWYAQDVSGNVWYMGESTKKLDNGKWVTEGSWKGGVDGAEPGIVMEAHPRVGDHYRQEYYKGHAEDEARVIATGKTITVGGRTYKDVITTSETSALEPDVVEQKNYTPGIGFFYLKTTKGPAEEQRFLSVTNS